MQAEPSDAELAQLTPIRIYREPAFGGVGLAVVWLDLRGLAFDRPFFQDTLDAALAEEGRARGTTAFDRLAGAAAARRAEATPARPGFVFHMARCGSTLVSRSLAEAAGARVLGEPNPLTDLVEALPWVPEAARVPALRDLLDLLAPPAGTPFVIKAMSALTCRLPLFLQAVPELRWAFVYRDPVEVLVSLVRQPNFAVGLHGEPQRAAVLTGIGAQEIARFSRAEWAFVLTHGICTRAVQAGQAAADGRFLAVDYARLPEAVTAAVAPHFGLTFSQDGLGRVEALWGRDAKQPERAFVDDRAAKQQAAPEPLRRAVAQRIAPLIEALRALPNA
jgi:hypothetical protein